MHHICVEKNQMARFTKDEMLSELQTIFLFEADHILMGAGESAAKRFVGIAVPDDGQYCFEAPDKVDLGRFQIADKFARGYDVAFAPSVLTAFDGSEFQDLIVFMLGTPRAGGVSAGGEEHRFMTPDGYCQTVADTAFARWKLEWDESGAGSHTFTTRELALLSNMTEGAVRNAIADKTENGLRAIPNTKPVSVEHDEALRWLTGRRGFIPSPKRPRDDRFLTEHLRDIRSPEMLGKLIERQLLSAFGSPQKVSDAIGWTADDVEKWCDGSFEFDERRARKLAEALDFDVPLFVGKALEVSLRRNFVSCGTAR
jgi:hypothetical protein